MFYFACDLAHVAKGHYPLILLCVTCTSSCLLCHTPHQAEVLHFTSYSLVIHCLWLSLMLLKVTISFALLLLTLSELCTVSHLITQVPVTWVLSQLHFALTLAFTVLFSLWLSLVVMWHFHHAPLPSFSILTNPNHSHLRLPTPTMDLTICGLRQLFCLVQHSHHVHQLFSWYHLTISASTYRLMV